MSADGANFFKPYDPTQNPLSYSLEKSGIKLQASNESGINVFTQKPAATGGQTIGGDDSTALGDALLEGNTTGQKSDTAVSAKDASVLTPEQVYAEALGFTRSTTSGKDAIGDPANSAALFAMNFNNNLKQTAANAAASYVPKSSTSSDANASGSTGSTGTNWLSGIKDGISMANGASQLAGGLSNALSSGGDSDVAKAEAKIKQGEAKEAEGTKLESENKQQYDNIMKENQQYQKEYEETGNKIADTKSNISELDRGIQDLTQQQGQAESELGSLRANNKDGKNDAKIRELESKIDQIKQNIEAKKQEKTKAEGELKELQTKQNDLKQKISGGDEKKQKCMDAMQKAKELKTEGQRLKKEGETEKKIAEAKAKEKAEGQEGTKKSEGTDKSGSKAETPKVDANGNISAKDIKDKQILTKLEADHGPADTYTKERYDTAAQSFEGKEQSQGMWATLKGALGFGGSSSTANTAPPAAPTDQKRKPEDE
ncbi:MAG: hypothetical protein PHX18_02655 [Candidatus Gastranaerophilales bacterium]|nr:hypothetical protein [Candidatus Gastranaerophilales bacterium]